LLVSPPWETPAPGTFRSRYISFASCSDGNKINLGTLQLEHADNEKQEELRARIAEARSEARAAGNPPTPLEDGNRGDLQAAQQIDCLDARLSAFESKLDSADPEVQALVQAALEGALPGAALDSLRRALQALPTVSDDTE